MRFLSETTRELFRRIFGAWAGRSPILPPQEMFQRLHEMDDVNDPAAIPSLLIMLSSKNDDLAKRAAEAIQRIVENCNPLELAHLDLEVRSLEDWDWPKFSVRDVLLLSRGFTNVVGVFSFHYSGHVRQAAVEALAKVHDGQELPFLMIRLNDWVQQVREEAKKAVLNRIRVDYLPHFLRCLSLVQ